MHFLLLFGIVLLPKAYSLKCFECMPSPDGSPCKQVEKECLPVQQCSSISLGTSVAGAVVNVNMKTCAMAEQCYQGSINLGVTRMTYGSKCCNSELCNTMDVPAYSKNAPNGKKCYTCDTPDKCTTVTECMGEEDRCVSVSVTSPVAATMKGCITKSMCGQSADMLQSPGAEYSCCEGDLCNSATSASAGLLLLMASLISMYMIS